MSNIEELPKYQALGLKLGIFDESDIQAWVNARLRETHTPSEKIIGLAYLEDWERPDLYAALFRLDDEGDVYEIMRSLFARISDKKLANIKYCRKLAKLLDQFAVDCEYNVPKDLNPIYVFYDEYSLAEKGIYSSIDDWHKQFKEFICSFRKEEE